MVVKLIAYLGGYFTSTTINPYVDINVQTPPSKDGTRDFTDVVADGSEI